MKGKIFALFVVALFFTGCFHDEDQPPEPPPVEPVNVTENDTPDQPGGPIITSQRNQTVAQPVENGEENGEVPSGHLSTPNASLVVYFIYVGTQEKQGDAIFIKKGDLDVLIDAGPSESANIVASFLESRSVDDIDVLVTTHADEEHYGGIQRVMDGYRIENVWWPGEVYEDATYQQLLDDLQGNGAQLRSVQRGDSFELNGITFEVVNPRSMQRFEDSDNDAIALRVTDREFCLLLTSDIQAGPEGDIANMDDMECAILQAPVHGLGRGHAKIDLMTLAIDPDVMIMSGGLDDSEWGYREPLYNKLNTWEIGYYENYMNGTIRIITDGTDYSIDYLSESLG